MKYVSKVTLSVNGAEVTDFKSFTVKEKEPRKQINLMNKTGHIKMMVRHSFSLDYVVPSGTKFNFEDVEDGTVLVEREDGSKIIFGGVATLKVGEEKYDGENEVVQTIEFGAEKRVDE
ncbi:MAG: hypothetical protein Q8J64_06620 [Thermodesulfovibrionales bacterium]|nr:hypothetical protein [Thermodesulfovibrionales bacterium]